jgi:hypothetical protein
MGEMPVSESTDLECEDFLEAVYGDTEGWIDLPAKVARHWVPFYTRWPNDSAVTRRIDSSLRDREDLYYSVAQFANRGRKIEDVLPSRWLWADLDEVHPSAGAALGLLPTIAVESSPGRYQALWRLSRKLRPAVLEKLNRGLTYALDADKGGWDLTQVLRIPGTRNYKYPDAPVVRALWLREVTEEAGCYDHREVWRVVRGAVPDDELRGVVRPSLPRKPISRRAKALLRTPVDGVVEGERSARLWELECLLAEAGLGLEEIFELTVNSAWNKWRGMGTGKERLKGDIRKAIRHVARKADNAGKKKTREVDTAERAGVHGRDSVVPDGGESDQVVPSDESGAVRDGSGANGGSGGGEGAEERLPWIGYSSFMAMVMEEPRWLIEGLWTAGSHGLIAGEPKTNKTTIALALALAVASGESFLGQYACGVQGPVLFVQEENAPWVIQDRMRKIGSLMGLVTERGSTSSSRGALGTKSVELDYPSDLPLKVLNNFGFDLALEEHREMLEAEVDEMRPKLLILDPLYLILGGADENASAQLRPFLKWLLQLRYKHDTAIAVVHHFRKQNAQHGIVRPGQRVMGNAVLHGWVDSALYMSAKDEPREGWIKTQVEREFRSLAPQKSLDVALSMGLPGDLEMTVEIESYSIEQTIRDIVLTEPGVTVTSLSERLSMDKRTLMARIRGGSGDMVIETGKKGRGHSHRVYMASGNGEVT